MIEKTETNEIQDDGGLACLNIPRDNDNKYFHCPVVQQHDILNREFYVIDFLPEVKTENGPRVLVLIKFALNDKDLDARKFFTSSTEIKHVLEEIEKRNKFPRRVTFRAHGHRRYFE